MAAPRDHRLVSALMAPLDGERTGQRVSHRTQPHLLLPRQVPNGQIADDSTLHTMPTTVRIRDEDKRALDRLQARMTLARGRVPLEEVLHRALAVAGRHEAEMAPDDGVARPAAEVRRLLGILEGDLGGRVGYGTIEDEDIYARRETRRR